MTSGCTSTSCARFWTARPSRGHRSIFNSFNAAAQAAGIPTPFDPFANEVNFLLGAFMLSDVGVTAYKGSARLINSRGILEAAAGILAVESYHMGAVRTRLFGIAQNNPGLGVADTVQRISNLRDQADGPADLDQGLFLGASANIVPADANSIVFGRTAAQVLSIVYLARAASGVTQGGFFPNGVNGAIRST